jgi:hypothetical protein
MKSMVISAEEKKEMATHSVVSDVPKYPYGLKLHFDDESFSKLELGKTPQVGDKMMMLAMVEVCEVRAESYEGDSKKTSMSVQITDLEIKEKEQSEPLAPKSVAQKLYGKE